MKVTSTTVQGSVLRRNPSLLASVDVVVAFNPNKEADKVRWFVHSAQYIMGTLFFYCLMGVSQDTAHLCSQAILPYIRVLTPSSGYKGTIVSMHSQVSALISLHQIWEGGQVVLLIIHMLILC